MSNYLTEVWNEEAKKMQSFFDEMEKVFKFEVHKIYFGRSLCDYNCKFKAQIVSRTAKTIKAIIDGNKEANRFKIHNHNGNEFIYPHGKYSMCPIIKAENEVTT